MGPAGMVQNTYIHRVHNFGISPVSVFLDRDTYQHESPTTAPNGVVDSLQYLLHDNFIRPWESEHILAAMLVRAF